MGCLHVGIGANIKTDNSHVGLGEIHRAIEELRELVARDDQVATIVER